MSRITNKKSVIFLRACFNLFSKNTISKIGTQEIKDFSYLEDFPTLDHTSHNIFYCKMTYIRIKKVEYIYSHIYTRNIEIEVAEKHQKNLKEK